MVFRACLLLAVMVSSVVCQDNRDWHVGVDRVNPSGTAVHGHANVPLHRSADGRGRLDGTVHGSRVFGGPHNRAQSVGGGLQYRHDSGFYGGVDATHQRGAGTSYSGSVGYSKRF